MLFADADTVHAELDYPFLIDALQAAHRTPCPETAVMVRDAPGGGDDKLVNLVGWGRAQGIAVKIVGVFPGNLALQPPQASIQGIVALFDPATGAPRLVADGEAMTFRKTAADSALGSRLLSRPDARVLLVVGAGGLAPHVAEAHLAARPAIERVVIWNRTPERAEALAGRLRATLGDVSAAGDLDAAVAEADVISCVTMADRPLVRGALLKPGTHLDLVGAYLPTMRETDDDAIGRGTVFVDTYAGMEAAGDLAQPAAAGTFDFADVAADYYALVAGRHPGRRSADEITVCKNVGGAHLDLFAADALLRRLTRTS